MTTMNSQFNRATRSAQPRLSAAAVTAVVLGLLAPASLAQPGSQGGSPPGGGYEPPEPEMQRPQAGAQADFEPATLDAFVEVFGELNEIREDYSNQIQQAEDTETAQQLQQEAQQEMVDRVNASDIDVETYNEISMRMNQDPAFARMVVNRTQE